MNEIKQILNGIDQQQIHSNDGWWETSAGADFGAKKLNEIEQAFKEVTSNRDDLLEALELLIDDLRLRAKLRGDDCLDVSDGRLYNAQKAIAKAKGE